MSDLDNLKVQAKFKDVIGEERDFSSLKSITEFFQKEQNYWQEASGKYGNNEVSNAYP